jgi:hypothetical protein
VDQLVQVAGAALVLTGFALAQLGVVETRAYSYLLVNLVGAGVLAVLAWHERQWGFVLLEAVWALVAAVGLAARLSRAERAHANAGAPTNRTDCGVETSPNRPCRSVTACEGVRPFPPA